MFKTNSRSKTGMENFLMGMGNFLVDHHLILNSDDHNDHQPPLSVATLVK